MATYEKALRPRQRNFLGVLSFGKGTAKNASASGSRYEGGLGTSHWDSDAGPGAPRPTPRKWRITFNAPGILTFVGICFVATVLGMVTGGAATQALFMSYHSSLLDPLTYLRLFTHVFGHANWAHFVGNMSLVLLLGPLLEEKHGTAFIWEVIVVTGFATGIVSYVLFPNVGLCGASGVVFAFILLASFTDFSEGEIPLTFLLVAAIYLGQQVIDGLTVQDDVANFAHIIGGVVGMVFGYLMNKREKK